MRYVKIGLMALCFGFVLFTITNFDASAATPASVSVKSIQKTQPPVTFPHQAHEAALQGKCADCHSSAAGGGAVKMASMADFHKQCLTCHKEGGKGPTACKDCHK